MIQVQATSASNYDFFFFNAAGQVWNGVSAWVTWVDANYQNYRMAATEISPPGTFRILDYPNTAVRWQFRLRDATLSGSTLIADGELDPPIDYASIDRPTRIAGEDSFVFPSAFLTGGSVADLGRTFIQNRLNTTIARQKSSVSRIKFYTSSAVYPGRIKFLVFRGGVKVQESDMFTIPHTTTTTSQLTFDLPEPLNFEKGDKFGVYHYANNVIDATLGVKATTGGNIKFSNGDLTTEAALATNVDGFTFLMEFIGTGADVCYTGDSIMEGANGDSQFYGHFQEALAYGGEESSQIGYWVDRFSRNASAWENLGRGNQTFAWVLSTGIPQCLLASPKAIVIHCGVNDVNTGRTWSSIESDLDGIRALVPRTTHLIIDEILPWTAGTSGNATTIRTFNANLATWCLDNHATLVRCHDLFRDPANPDGLLPAYDQDGVHLTTQGVMLLARLIANAIDGQSELTAIENSTVLAREKSVINVQALL